MDRHLVAVEVGIVCSTYQRMKLDSLTFHKNRLECLYAESVERRGTVQHDRMLLDDIFQYIPHFRLQPLHHFLRIFDIVCRAVLYKLLHYKRLEQLYRHLFRQAALVYLKFRPYYDNRTA